MSTMKAHTDVQYTPVSLADGGGSGCIQLADNTLWPAEPAEPAEPLSAF